MSEKKRRKVLFPALGFGLSSQGPHDGAAEELLIETTMPFDSDQFLSEISNWIQRKPIKQAFYEVEELGAAIGSSIGKVREENQDRAVIASIPSRPNSPALIAFILCDGIGGMRNGGECSTLAISSFITALSTIKGASLNAKIAEAAQFSNKAVYNKFQGNGGTTLSVVVYDTSGSRAALNVGDSRIYQYYESKLFQLSKDDTLQEQLQQIRGDQAHAGRAGNYLTQSIGMGDGLFSNPLFLDSPKEIDGIILTTDGLHSFNANLLEEIVISAPSAPVMARRLTSLRSWGYAKDNITMIAIPKGFKYLASSPLYGSKVIRLWDSSGEVVFPSLVTAPVIMDRPISSWSGKSEKKYFSTKEEKTSKNPKRRHKKKDKPKQGGAEISLL